jgi:hypothetical protein
VKAFRSNTTGRCAAALLAMVLMQEDGALEDVNPARFDDLLAFEFAVLGIVLLALGLHLARLPRYIEHNVNTSQRPDGRRPRAGSCRHTLAAGEPAGHRGRR